MRQSNRRDFRIFAYFKGSWELEYVQQLVEALEAVEFIRKSRPVGYAASLGLKETMPSWYDAVRRLEVSDTYSVNHSQKEGPYLTISFQHDSTGMTMYFGGEIEESKLRILELQFEGVVRVVMDHSGLQELTFVSLPFDNYGLDEIDIPTCVAPFHVHCYKAAYRRDYYTQFMSREDMLRLPAYKVTEREDGSVVTQIYPDMMAGESAEALDFMERCAVHFKKYHRKIDTSMYNNPANWAEGGFHYERERRLFGPNGLDGVVPQDLGLL